jgi:WD40 repeat protein
LSICALQIGYTPEADTTLQRALLSMDAVLTVPGNSGVFNSAVFSPDGKYFLVTEDDGAHLRNVETGEEIKVFPTDRPLYEFATGVFSSNGQYILSNTGPDTARLWDVETGTAIREFTALGDWAIPALSPDGEYAAFTVNGDIQLWKVDSGTLERTLSTDLSGVEWITFSPDGTSLLIGGHPTQPSAVHQWDIKTDTKIRDFLGLRSETNVAVFSPDGRYVISGGDPGDARAILWDAKTGAQIRTFRDFPVRYGYNNVQTFAFSPDSRHVLIGSANRTARMFDVETGLEVRRFEDNKGYVVSVGFSPDGRKILIGSYQGGIYLWPTSVPDFIAEACTKVTRDFTAEERATYGISGDAPTCPQFGENYELPAGMTPIPVAPLPVWTPLPPLEDAGS